jgi:hypothetical protein
MWRNRNINVISIVSAKIMAKIISEISTKIISIWRNGQYQRNGNINNGENNIKMASA